MHIIAETYLKLLRRKGKHPIMGGWGEVVYVIRVGDGFYKIGKTKNLTDRLEALNCGRIELAEIIHVILSDNASLAERRLLMTLREFRVRGEVFRLDSKVIERLLLLETINKETRLEFLVET